MISSESRRQLVFTLLTYGQHTLRCSKLRFLDLLASDLHLFELTFIVVVQKISNDKRRISASACFYATHVWITHASSLKTTLPDFFSLLTSTFLNTLSLLRF